MAQAFRISTDGIAQHDRFNFWHEAVSAQLTGMRMDTSSTDREGFWARLSGYRFSQGGLIDVDRSSCLVHRGRSEIDRSPQHSLLIYRSWKVPSWFEVHGKGDFTAESGSIVVGYSDMPFSHIALGEKASHCQLIRLSLSLIEPVADTRPRTRPRIIRADAGVGALFASYLDSWCRQLPAIEPDMFGFTAQTLAHLAAMAFGISGPPEEPTRAAVRAGRLEALNRFMVTNLQRSDLTPDLAAAALGISVRQVHLLFEPTGLTFSRRVLDLRLKKAEALLVDRPALPVTEVALACGFDSLATFYRQFKARFGMTATEYRENASKAGRSSEP